MDTEIEDLDERVARFAVTHRPWVLPILRVLRAHGGQASPKVVEAEVGKMVRGQISKERWKHVLKNRHIDWTRLHLRQAGLLEGEPGVWQLTPVAVRYLAAHDKDALVLPRGTPDEAPREEVRPKEKLEAVECTHSRAYELPLLQVLFEAPKLKKELLAELQRQLGESLLPGDFRQMPNGPIVWAYRASWALTQLKLNGEVTSKARASWEITPAGRERLTAEKDTWKITAYQPSNVYVRPLHAAEAADEPSEDAERPSSWSLAVWEALKAKVDPEVFRSLDHRLRPDLLLGAEGAGRRMARNVVLYGPPGTGKTFLAKEIAKALTGEAEPSPDGRWRVVQFHPSYSYEDFIQGMKPDLKHTELRYRLKSGPFKEMCSVAEQDPERFYVLVIDEINRGDPARIFGELLYALEYRGERVALPLGDELMVPPNLVVVGTMNSADRSVGLMDYALRRRFGFVRIQPEPGLITRLRAPEEPAAMAMAVLESFNGWLASELGPEHVLGHSFFLNPGLTLDGQGALDTVWRMDVLPLMEEFFYGDRSKVEEAKRQWDAAMTEATSVASEGEG